MKSQSRITWMAAALFMAATLMAGPAAADVTEIRVLGGGGKSGDAIKQAYIAPFVEKSGIKVVFEKRSKGSPLGALRAMIESGNITAALVEMGGSALDQAIALDLVEPLDWTAIDPAPIFPEAKNPMGIGFQYYSVIMAWRSDAKPIKDWKDFWNVKDFPGKRALPDIPYYALPAALLADGVPPDQLYPIDIDRAFKSLEKIKDHVAVWTTSGAQPPQLLRDNEVQYAAPYSGRVAGLEGISYDFNQGLLGISYFVVPKGVDPEQKKIAMKLLHEFTLAENQAKAANVVSYTGPSPALDALLPKDRLGEFPTARKNKDRQILPNTTYWFENAEMVEQRWQEFKLGL